MVKSMFQGRPNMPGHLAVYTGSLTTGEMMVGVGGGDADHTALQCASWSRKIENVGNNTISWRCPYKNYLYPFFVPR